MADLPSSLAADAFAMFRWQVALVDAITSPDDPHSFEQLFVSCATSAGGWACWERSSRALRIEINNASCSNLQKGGSIYSGPRALFRTGLLPWSQYVG